MPIVEVAQKLTTEEMADPVEAQRKIWEAVVAKNNAADDVVSVSMADHSRSAFSIRTSN